jgi:hypothetical protein
MGRCFDNMVGHVQWVRVIPRPPHHPGPPIHGGTHIVYVWLIVDYCCCCCCCCCSPLECLLPVDGCMATSTSACSSNRRGLARRTCGLVKRPGTRRPCELIMVWSDRHCSVDGTLHSKSTKCWWTWARIRFINKSSACTSAFGVQIILPVHRQEWLKPSKWRGVDTTPDLRLPSGTHSSDPCTPNITTVGDPDASWS